MSIHPMQSAHDAARCGAKSKRTGKPCRAPAVRGCRVCRMHGAGGGCCPRVIAGRFTKPPAARSSAGANLLLSPRQRELTVFK
jgi:hypothetical protein